MDIVGTIVSAIVKALGYVISAVVLAARPILVSLYNQFISRDLLRPGEAYPNITSGTLGSGVQYLYYYTLFQIYDPVLTLILVALGILILLNSSLNLGYNLKHIWIKILLIIIVSNLAFFLAEDLIFLAGIIYSTLWTYGGSNHNFANGNNILGGLQLGGSAGADVSFLILVIFIFLMLFLLIYLAFRLAILYTFPIILPIFSIFYLLPQTQELAKRSWDIFIDSVFAPVLMAFPLILSTYVKNNSMLTLGFLALTDAIPILLSKSGSSKIAGLFLGQSVSTAAQKSMSYAKTGYRTAMTAATTAYGGGAQLISQISASKKETSGTIRQFSDRLSSTKQQSYSESMFFKPIANGNPKEPLFHEDNSHSSTLGKAS
ncbi:MAG: hypothetical protein M1526_02820 [Candidatus Thermoplasmatota archaeon]|jgi:hypothetical protein|nr:hypothetical protein [Candidatus Thermoplasmatota archaeon]